MQISEIVQRRLSNQRLAGAPFEQPEEVVRWLGAVQSQEYPGAKWGLAQRADGLRNAAIDAAFAEGRLLRTHVMRPTWHFVAPADIRWLLQLTGPRVNTVVGSYYRKYGLDEAVFARSRVALEQALEGGRQLTRNELAAALDQAGIPSPVEDRLRFSFIVMRAELDGVICSGALRGKQHTYALLEERVPPVPPREKDEALAELAQRYFTSHGPAALKDFSWWSGLTAAEARVGVESARPQLAEAIVDGIPYYFDPAAPVIPAASPTAHLLPAYDEYTIAYKDHRALMNPQYADRIIAAFGIVFTLDGRIAGAWKRTLLKDKVVVALTPFRALTGAESEAIAAAVQRFGEFLGLPVELEWVSAPAGQS